MNLREHLRERGCPVCGSEDRSNVVHRASFDEEQLDDFAFASRKLPELMHLNLVRCPTCALVYASPAFTPEFLALAYERAAYDSGEEANYAARSYATLLPAIVRSLPKVQSALEIGAGNGAFLSELKRAGFQSVCGVEPSSAASGTAKPEVRDLIRQGVFCADDFPPASFDLLACFQTMEHLENPREICTSALTLLRPGGAICLVVHDYDSWVTRLLGRKSPIFDVEHQQLFSKSSIRYLLKSCGFERIEVRTIRNQYPLSYWFRLAPLSKSLKSAAIGILKAAHLDTAALTLDIGNLGVMAFKPETMT